MKPECEYAPLRVRSNRSLRSGASTLEGLVTRARSGGAGAMALTDEGNLYGAVSFFEEAQGAGVRPILGAIVSDDEGDQVVLIVRDCEGYASLCRILSRRSLEEGFDLVRVVAEHQGGLFVLSPKASLAGRLAEVLDGGRLRIEIIRPALSENRERELLEAARRLDVPVVASVDIYMAEPRDFELHEILSAMGECTVLPAVQPRLAHRQGGYLRSCEEMSRLYSDMPEALAETVRVACECDFDLLAREAVFPRLEGDSLRRLWADSLAGARGKYDTLSAEVLGRLRSELSLIDRLGFADYFLVVADIVRHARSLGTPVAGRGSGASSLVAYSLGITNVDPLVYNLPFERFLNEGRRDYPDLDIDFCWRLRDDVIDYVYKTYGADHVAMIATYATLQPRLAFREVSKALGVSNDDITRIAGKLRHGLPRNRWHTLPAAPETIEKALYFAGRLEGYPHHLSVHCGGVVITPDGISGHAPLQRAEKGVVITQYDKDGVEAVGLVKLDLLGNRALSSAAEAVRLVKEDRGDAIDPEALPDGDEQTVKVLCSGDTIGVNQLESPAMRHLLRQIRPGSILGVMQVLALIRPGAASLGMKEAYVRRARGIDPVPAIDARLDGILGETYGIMLYEDDALLIAAALAGLERDEADRFRRAVTKCRSDDERLRLSRDFLGRCRDRDVRRETAEDLWVQMSKFNSYSFCRAHAASYARLAWANAWMRAHHPAEFWTAALNNNQGMYPKWSYVEEAKRMGVAMRLPCVNRSGREFVLKDGAIRVGLGRVAGLSDRAIESIIEARPFRSLVDLIARSKVRIADAESLVRCGALDMTGRSRPEMLFELHTGFDEAKGLRGRVELFGAVPEPKAGGGATLAGYPESRKFADEWELLDLSCRRHPIAPVRGALARMGVSGSDAMGRGEGMPVVVAGVAAAGRKTHTDSGEAMCFMTLSDEWGIFEATLFPDLYRRSRMLLSEEGMGPYVVEGVVESQYGATSVTASRVHSVRGYARYRKSACGVARQIVSSRQLS